MKRERTTQVCAKRMDTSVTMTSEIMMHEQRGSLAMLMKKNGTLGRMMIVDG